MKKSAIDRYKRKLDCERKIAYTSKEPAERHLQELRDKHTFLPKKNPLEVYLCPHPGDLGRHYHVGHRPWYLDLSSKERLLNKRLRRRKLQGSGDS